MTLPLPNTLTETEVKEILEKLKESSEEEDPIGWSLDAVKFHPKLLAAASEVFAKSVKESTSITSLKRCIEVLEAKVKTLPVVLENASEDASILVHAVAFSLVVQSRADDSLNTICDSFLTRLRPIVYKSDATVSAVTDKIRDLVLPIIKDSVDSKKYTKALRMWRSIVRFTGFEKLPTPITNRILHIATMAFKENNADVHINAFKSWTVLIESLPRVTLKKTAYIRLLLNPLNRSYRDIDAITSPHKFETWWRLIMTLGDDVNTHFDEVVCSLLQKTFKVPSAKVRQVNPAATAASSREVSPYAYDVLLKLLQNGGTIKGSVDELPHLPFVLNDACFAKHLNLIDDLLNLVINNHLSGGTKVPEGYFYELCKVLFSRTTSLHNGNHHGLLRVFLITIYKILQKRFLNMTQMLDVFDDLTNGIPQKVMVSSQFNLREGSFSMHECPLISLTALLIEDISKICTGDEHKRYCLLLKVLLERATSGMNIPPFISSLVKSLGEMEENLKVETWTEVTNFCLEFIQKSKGEESRFEQDFSGALDMLIFPFKPESSLLGNVQEKWAQLFTAFFDETSPSDKKLLTEQIEELCDVVVSFLKNTKNEQTLLVSCDVIHHIISAVKMERIEYKKSSSNNGFLESIMSCFKILSQNVSHCSKKDLMSGKIIKSFTVFLKNAPNNEVFGDVMKGLEDVKDLVSDESSTGCLISVVELLELIHKKQKDTGDSFAESSDALETLLSNMEGMRNIDLEGVLSRFKSGKDADQTLGDETLKLEVPVMTPDIQKSKRISRVPRINGARSQPPSVTGDSKKKVCASPMPSPARRSLRQSMRKARVSIDENKSSQDSKGSPTEESRRSPEIPIDNLIELEDDVVIDQEMAERSVTIIDLTEDTVIEDAETSKEVMVEETPVKVELIEESIVEESRVSEQKGTEVVEDEENFEPGTKRLRTETGGISTPTLERAIPPTDLPLQANGARKRKLGQVAGSPFRGNFQRNKFLIDSPSTRAKKMLEAAQINLGENLLSTAGFTPARNSIKADPEDMEQNQGDGQPQCTLKFETPPRKASRSILKRASTLSQPKSVSFSSTEQFCSFEISRTEERNEETFNIDNRENLQSADAGQPTGIKVQPEIPLPMEEQDTITVMEGTELGPGSMKGVQTLTDDPETSALEGTFIVQDSRQNNLPVAIFQNSCARDSAPPSHLPQPCSTAGEAVDPYENIVGIVSTVKGGKREELLKHISSEQFLGNLTSQERASFIKDMLWSISKYIR